MSNSAGWRGILARAALAAAVAALAVPAASAAAPPQIVDENGNNNGSSVPWPEFDEEVDGGSSGQNVPPPDVTTDAGTTIPAGGSSCMWNVKGRLVVRTPTVEGLDDNDPIAGVEVKVSGRSGLWFNEWDTDVTDANGDFSVPNIECSHSRVKVEARLKDDRLRVKGPSSPEWYLLYENAGELAPSTIDLRREPFGAESGDQGSSQARTDAQTWIVHQRALDHLDDLGYPALNDVTVHNPATLAPNGSWSDPILHENHIEPANSTSLDTMLHELGHAWAYPREIGEGCLTSAVIADQDTHDFEENPCTAFNEGFADFFADKLELSMDVNGVVSTSETESSVMPRNRADLVSSGLISLDRMETNEFGWEQAFQVLTTPDITRHLFGLPWAPRARSGPTADRSAPAARAGRSS